ncbi:MAG TPA: hypothetical protein VNA20_10165 [Frankiaceae bacterium]|nr:hypothetical protein [Frankiaceae bacterium]
MQSTLRRAAFAAVALAASLLAVPQASAQTGAKAPAASADAYALDVDARLLNGSIPVDFGPRARSSQEYPPQAPAPAEASELKVGEVPAGGALVQSVGVMTSFAGANSQPLAAAASQTVDVRLLAQAGVPLIQADVLKAVSTTDCINPPSAAGTEIVNLRVSTFDPITNPEPNFDVLPQVFGPLGLRVIANEQFPTADGRGLVVNALHIYNTSGATVPLSLFTGDLIVSHAMSTVNCPNGAPSTGGNNPIFIEKNSDKAKAKPGDTVTYTATIENKAATPCLVNQVIDHLPQAFSFESTSGAFGTTATTVNRTGGGTDVILKPSNVTIPAGGSGTQTFVVKVRDDATEGTYFNNVEILCGNLGNFVKGLDAPVTVDFGDEEPPPPPDKPQCDDGEDNDGDGKIDFPADPGCSSKQDDNEVDEHPRTGGRDLAGLAILLMLGAYAVRRKAATI